MNFAHRFIRRLRYDTHVRSKIETFIEGDVVKLPPLPYKLSALQPIISEEIMNLHYNKHHQAYIDNYNKVMKTYYDIIDEKAFAKAVETANFHGGGHINHSLFWQNLRPPKTNNKPEGFLLELIENNFVSFENMKAQLSRICTDVLGAGWGWLALDPVDGSLSVEETSNQEILQMKKRIDVWEHAYILQYNERKDYVDAMFEVLNWDFALSQLNEYAKKFNIEQKIIPINN